MKTFKFNELSRKAKTFAIFEAFKYLDEQFERYGTDEWRKNDKNCFEELNSFVYTANGDAYDVIGGRA